MMHGLASSVGVLMAASEAACAEELFVKRILAWETAKGAVRLVSM